MRLCSIANAKSSVDINAVWLQHCFYMPTWVAECCTVWKFDRQNFGFIKGLLCWYLLSTVVKCNFWCCIWCIRVSHSTVFVTWNIVVKKLLLMWTWIILWHMLNNFCYAGKSYSATQYNVDNPYLKRQVETLAMRVPKKKHKVLLRDFVPRPW